MERTVGIPSRTMSPATGAVVMRSNVRAALFRADSAVRFVWSLAVDSMLGCLRGLFAVFLQEYRRGPTLGETSGCLTYMKPIPYDICTMAKPAALLYSRKHDDCEHFLPTPHRLPPLVAPLELQAGAGHSVAVKKPKISFNEEPAERGFSCKYTERRFRGVSDQRPRSMT